MGRRTKPTKAPPFVPRIVEVANQIASLQADRSRLNHAIEANDKKGEVLDNALAVVDSMQVTAEREMDQLTRSQVVRR